MLKFEYFAGEQRTEPWFEIRLGKVTASRLYDWLAVSKRDGSPLKARLDYEQEIMFEREFKTPFEHYISSAMQEGIDFEDFIRDQYAQITEFTVVPVGAWYNDHFCASPDGGVKDEGLLEIKLLKDTSFTDVLANGVPEKHWQQIQGQLWASDRKWCDYVAASLSTRKIKIIRVKPDKEFHKKLEKSVQEPLTVKPFDKKFVFDFVEVPPSLNIEIPSEIKF